METFEQTYIILDIICSFTYWKQDLTNPSYQGEIALKLYEKENSGQESIYPNERTIGFSAIGTDFMEAVTKLFEIFPYTNSSYIKGQEIKVTFSEHESIVKKIQSVNTGKSYYPPH